MIELTEPLTVGKFYELIFPIKYDLVIGYKVTKEGAWIYGIENYNADFRIERKLHQLFFSPHTERLEKERILNYEYSEKHKPLTVGRLKRILQHLPKNLEVGFKPNFEFEWIYILKSYARVVFKGEGIKKEKLIFSPYDTQ